MSTLATQVTLAERFLEAATPPGTVNVLRTPRGRLVALRDPTDGKIGWNIDQYDQEEWCPENATLAGLLLCMDDGQRARAYAYRQEKLEQRLVYVLRGRKEVTFK